nr:hypothetical protein [Alcaligenes faecalis]
MSAEIAALLASIGPMTSGALASILVTNLNITPATARKRIERRTLPVRAVKLAFPRGAQFLYLESQYGSLKFWNRLSDALMNGNGAYARAIRALTVRGGIIPVSHFATASGTSNAQRQIHADEVIKRLVDAELLQIVEMPGLGSCVSFARGESYIDDRFPEVRARLIAEKVLLQSIQEWAAKLGFGSFHSFKLRATEVAQPSVGPFSWDLTAPSFLGPLANWTDPTKPKPGFLVVDVLLSEVVDVADVSPFLYKCTSLRQFRSVGRCMQFFVANRYSQEALNEIRRAGIVPATPEALFGTDVSKALLMLLRMLSEAAGKAVDPILFSELFERLGRAEGAVGTLRGALFEYVVAEIIRQLEPPADITMNRIYREGGKDVAEVDVQIIIKNRRIRLIECKGLLPGSLLGDEEVEKWLNRRIPVVLAQIRRDNVLSKLEQQFELWMTGELTEDAKAMIAAAQDRAFRKGYSINVLNATEINKQIGLVNDPSLRKVVEQHFLLAPMAFPDAVNNQPSKQSVLQSPFDLGCTNAQAAVTPS